MLRPGFYSWMVEVEYTQFKPDTDANELFHMAVCQWPKDAPLLIGVISIHKSGQAFADSILAKHGLKRSPPGMVLRMLGGQKRIQDFFVKGPNTCVLENFGKNNVAYTNDPVKRTEAFEKESELAQTFFDAHKQWLETPEGKAQYDAYWAKHPSGKVY